MELTLDQALQKGIEAHKAGKVQEADRYYTAILKANPKHPDASHNMGVLAVGLGKVETALPFFKTALEVNSNIAQYWLSYIDALIRLDRLADAKAIFDQAKNNGAKGDGFDQLEKRLVDTENATTSNAQEPPEDQLQGLINLHTQGQHREALNKGSQLLRQFPNSINLYNIIGSTNKSLGKLDEAIEAYTKAISIKPDYADAYNNMGIALKDQGKLDQAIEAYTKALTHKPDYAEAYTNMGNALNEQGRLDEAIEAYTKALTHKPDNAEAYTNMGVTLHDQGKLDEAIKAYTKALTLAPGNADVYNNMGNAFKQKGKLDEAIEAYTKALTHKPDYAEAYYKINEILKVYSPQKKISHVLYVNDQKIKKLSSRIMHTASNREIINNLSKGLNYLNEDSYRYKTPLSQIVMHNMTDLNCFRHMKIFDEKEIIPEFCFGCFKVQVEVTSFVDLIKVTSIFYNFDFEEDLTRKTMIELRSNVSGYYKGFIYCNGLDQAKAVKDVLDISLRDYFCPRNRSIIKRGCSEYALTFPEYGKIAEKPEEMMDFPKEWKQLEKQFDQNELIEPNHPAQAAMPAYCSSDFYIIQKWIDYAKGIDDKSVKAFRGMPIVFKDIYELAKTRSMS